MKPIRVFINQYNHVYYARTIKKLRQQVPGRIGKMYCDDKQGKSYNIGYVIGQEWLTEYKSVIRS